jgi:hypothetical protein
LNEGTRGPMGRKSGHGVVFMTHHRRQPGRSRRHTSGRTALTRGFGGVVATLLYIVRFFVISSQRKKNISN